MHYTPMGFKFTIELERQTDLETTRTFSRFFQGNYLGILTSTAREFYLLHIHICNIKTLRYDPSLDNISSTLKKQPP